MDLTCRIYQVLRRGLIPCLLLAPGISGAAESITLQRAIERALADSPELALSEHERAMEEGRVRQSGLRPRVGLDLEMENMLGSGIYESGDRSETTLSLVWVLERGKRTLRSAAAEAGLSETVVDAELRRIEVAADTAEAFLDVLRDQERLELAEAAVDLAERARSVVAERVRIARSPQIDLDRAEADLTWRRLDREDVMHELLVSRRVLASRWGAGAPDFDKVSGDISSHPEPAAYAELVADLSASPLINRYLTRRRLREAQLRLAQAQARPDWLVRTGARYLAATDDMALVAGISLPIGRSNPNQGLIDSARAGVGRADAELVAKRVEIEATLFRLHQELVHNLHRAESIRKQIIPLLESVVADSREAYARGRYSYQELRQSQLNLLEARRVYLHENYQGQANRIAIERLTGVTVERRYGGQAASE